MQKNTSLCVGLRVVRLIGLTIFCALLIGSLAILWDGKTAFAQTVCYTDCIADGSTPTECNAACAQSTCFDNCRQGNNTPTECNALCTGNIGSDVPTCLTAPGEWVFEKSLRIGPLGAFRPNIGLEFFGWFFLATMALVSVLALTMIAVGGLQYIAAAGNTGRMGRARERINSALIGLILAMASVLILYTINPELVTLRLPAMRTPVGTRNAGAAQTELCNEFGGTDRGKLQAACTSDTPCSFSTGGGNDICTHSGLAESSDCLDVFGATCRALGRDFGLDPVVAGRWTCWAP